MVVGGAEHCARRLQQSLPLHFDHAVFSGGYRRTNDLGSNRPYWLSLFLFFRCFLLDLLLFFNNLLSVLVILFHFLNDYLWLWLWWWRLKRSEHLHIGIEIKESKETVRVIGGGPDVDVTLDTSRSKVLVFLLVAERNDLRNGLSVGQFKNVQLVLVR